MKTKTTLFLLLLIGAVANAQVRPDITDFTSEQRTELANLIIDFVDVEIIQIHCDYTNHMDVGLYDIHDDFNFFAFS